jgi:phosphate transport system substrate-binding protein
MNINRALSVSLVAFAAFCTLGCEKKDGAQNGGGTESSATVRLNGAGATFPAPLYKRWVTEYEAVKPGVRVDYESVGSGAGIRTITAKTSHFGASDAPLKASELEKMGGESAVIEFPSVAGAVVMIYNVPGMDVDLKLTGDLIADIYLGKVTNWNDARIAALNPGIEMPDLTITPAYRTDGSGTTFVFTNYLSTQSDEFKSTVGTGKQVQWKFGQGGKGNEGVTQVVQQTKGGIGYVEDKYAKQNGQATAAVKNLAGKFVKASPDSVAAAGAGASDQMSGNLLAADIWNQPGDESYPIAAFTYLIVYSDLNNMSDKAAAQHLVDFLWWVTHDGQAMAADMNYAPLAPAVQAKVEAALKTLTYNGQALKVGE